MAHAEITRVESVSINGRNDLWTCLLLLGGKFDSLVPFLSDSLIETLVIHYHEQDKTILFGSADNTKGLKTALRNAKIPFPVYQSVL
jgi:hypothetical protein